MLDIWMVAAENGALPGGKVGGVGDVLRDLPAALARSGDRLRVVTPAYGRFHTLPGAKLHRTVVVAFGGGKRRVRIFRVPGGPKGVQQFVLEHSLMSPAGAGRIYVADGPNDPFATDAGKFAFFCAAVEAWLRRSDNPPDVLHLHDWHSALVPALQAWRGDARGTRTVLTIHNLAYQGIRPFRSHASSLEAWFPGLAGAVAEVHDPNYPGCVNFMAAGIRLAQAVNTVSPGYAREIVEPNDPARGFHGGEGLDALLREAAAAGRLHGILNGCEYPAKPAPRPAWPDLLEQIRSQPRLVDDNKPARRWLERAPEARPRTLLVSIGRTSAQKVALFLEPVAGGACALDRILDQAGDGAQMIMLGSGDADLEQRLVSIAGRRRNLLYLRGYAEDLAEPLYAAGDLFLMPSSFEPCGISQMLAMRAGQPCVVHAVGGLRDTVEDGVTGFTFTGEDPPGQARAFVAAVQRALAVKWGSPARWQQVCDAARSRRFDWNRSARAYRALLYGEASDG